MSPLFTIWNSGGCVAVPFLPCFPHHHLDMNFYYIFLDLLLLVVLSAYSESPQQRDPLDLTVVAVCPNSNSDSLGVLAPVLS
jgi:hypothetical protein